MSDVAIPLGYVWLTQKGQWFSVAVATVVFWDHASTLDLEVELIWKKKVSFVQVLYLINRYGSLVLFLHGLSVQMWLKGDQFTNLCNSYGKVQFWLGGATANAMQGLMIHRMYSMYRQRRRALIVIMTLLGTLILSEFIISLILSVNGTRGKGTGTTLSQSLHTCQAGGTYPKWAMTSWFLSIVFDLIIVGFTLWEGIRFLKEAERLSELSATAQGAHKYHFARNWSRQGILFQILMRDSLLFPFLGTLASLLNVVGWLATPIESGFAMYPIIAGTATTPILGCRLVLNLRNAYYQPFSNEIEMSMQDFNLDFLSEDDSVELRGVASKISRRSGGRSRTDCEEAQPIPIPPLSTSRSLRHGKSESSLSQRSADS
ncbi:hypothetical protein D9611_010218 [Ephemerocybe angulata]|uniref:DUF6533 domain-containing protein n=1 Tax=Ephemerocybe angulata TaxID=980116 RepID=A0A8H5AZH5_9AGAR|nr:hypothetical protein D9611_010218 [Tulosesus angulatus]